LSWSEEQTEHFLRYDRAIMESNTAEYHIIEYALDAAGNTRCLDTSKVPLHDAAGKVNGILVAFEDITERKLAEQALRSQTALLEAQLNATVDGILVVTDQGKRMLSNARLLELLQVPERVIADDNDVPLLEHVANRVKDRDAFLEKVKYLYAHRNETSRDEIEFINGMILDRYSSPVLGNDGTYHGRIWTFRDITEQKRLESALERRVIALTRPMGDNGQLVFEELFSLEDIQKIQDAFARATEVASIITRPDGTPITRPSNFTHLCSEIIRKTEKGSLNCFRSDSALGGFHPGGPMVRPCQSCGLWDAGTSISVGGYHVANWMIGQVRDESQSPEQMAAYAREIGVDEGLFLAAFHEVPAMSRERFNQIAESLFILAGRLSDSAFQNVQQARFLSEKNAAEAEVRRLNENLEKRVQARTTQLEIANREIEAFSYSVSHDLRTPLRSIDGFARILEEDHRDQLDESGRHHLSRIHLAAQRMGTLIDDLLKLAKTTRSELTVSDCHLSSLCSRATANLADLTPERKVEVSIRPGMRVQADPNLMQVVLENLLGNAWKFTIKSQDPRIWAGELIAPDGERVFFVRDNGAGFDMAQAGRLFTAFQRLHAASEFEGTGIGLAIVQRIIHRHGGRIWAEAEPGNGATFFFTIPSRENMHSH
jgi:signal transduction histidine kinase/PAS domain-containing protein